MRHQFRPRLDILPAAQSRLWPDLRGAQDLGFVLYGGTAIALQLGHRQSVDFDFFTDRTFDDDAIRQAVPAVAGALTIQQSRNTLSVQTSANGGETVNLSFFGGLSIGRVGEPRRTDDGVADIASLDDLLATTVKVLLQRVEAKDYIDIAALIEAGVDLARGLASARVIYGDAFQPSECLKALTYFEGGDLDLLSEDTKTILVREVDQIGPLPTVEIRSRTLSGGNDTG